MGIDYSGSARLKKFGPKIGEADVLHIREITKIEDPTGTLEENFRSRVKNWGFHYECVLTNDRVFLLNNWKLYYAFRDANVQDGDLIQINHPGEGVYEVEVLERGTGIDVVVPDEEKEAYLAKKRSENEGTKPESTKTKATAKASTKIAPKSENPDVDLPF